MKTPADIPVSGVTTSTVGGVQLELEPGWNLISLQVGGSNGFPVAEFQTMINSNRADNLQALWAFDPEEDTWQTHQPQIPSFPAANGYNVDRAWPKAGYWAKVAEYTQVEITGEKEAIVQSGGSLRLSSSKEMKIDSEEDLRLNGKMIHIN